MKYTRLGNSELNVSRVCMGCMGFGDPQKGMHSWTLDEESSQAVEAPYVSHKLVGVMAQNG